MQGQSELVPRKPDPASILHVLSELDIDSDACVYIGDSEVDMKTGKGAHITTVGVSWGFRTRETLEALNATVIDKPEELLNFLKNMNTKIMHKSAQ